MCYCTILTGSYFVHFGSKNKTPIPQAAKDLSEILLDYVLGGRNNEITITKPTHDDISDAFSDYPNMQRIMLIAIKVEDYTDESFEIPAVIELANLKKDVYEEVLIINGSNSYDEYRASLPADINIKILNEIDALAYIKENWD